MKGLWFRELILVLRCTLFVCLMKRDLQTTALLVASLCIGKYVRFFFSGFPPSPVLVWVRGDQRRRTCWGVQTTVFFFPFPSNYLTLLGYDAHCQSQSPRQKKKIRRNNWGRKVLLRGAHMIRVSKSGVHVRSSSISCDCSVTFHVGRSRLVSCGSADVRVASLTSLRGVQQRKTDCLWVR